MLHELSHAWVSEDRFDQRWISEGLAQVLAERAVKATGGTPARHPKVTRGRRGRSPSTAGVGRRAQRAESVDDYAYPAAYTATTALVRPARRRPAVGGAQRGHPRGARLRPGRQQGRQRRRTDWMRWLDLLQTRAGVKDAAQVVQRWALTPKQRATLAPRATARTAYAKVDAADGAWLPPEGLRAAMTDWDFARAAQVRDAGGRARGRRERRAGGGAAGGHRGAGCRARLLRARGHATSSTRPSATTLPQAAAAITAVAAAQRAAAQHRDPLSAVGAVALGVQGRADEASAQLDQGEYAQASSTAAEVVQPVGPGAAGRPRAAGAAPPAARRGRLLVAPAPVRPGLADVHRANRC